MIETPADRAAFLADFGTAVAIWPGGTGPLDARAIFTAAHAAALDGTVTATAPMLAGFTHDLGTLTRGDRVDANGATYRVADLQPDGTGMVRVILEED